MTENIDQSSLFIHTLKALMPTAVVIGATLMGAVAHALEEVKRAGWKGWLSFISDIIICSFVGWIFFHAIILAGKPDWAIVGCSIGSYWGTKGFVKVRNWFIDSLTKLKL